MFEGWKKAQVVQSGRPDFAGEAPQLFFHFFQGGLHLLKLPVQTRLQLARQFFERQMRSNQKLS